MRGATAFWSGPKEIKIIILDTFYSDNSIVIAKRFDTTIRIEYLNELNNSELRI